MVTCGTISCPGVTKTNNRPKVKKRLFLKKNSSQDSSSSSIQRKTAASSQLKDVAASMKKLSCGSTEESSHTARKGDRGAMKVNRSRRGWAVNKQRKGGWEGGKDDSGGAEWETGRTRWQIGMGKEGKMQKKKSSPISGYSNDMSPDFVPYKKRNYAKTYNKVAQPNSVYTQPDQKLRGTSLSQVFKSKMFCSILYYICYIIIL